MATYRLIKWLLNIDSNITDSINTNSMTIAYKCPILANLGEFMDHKKTFP
jgi:hypothetical protein